MQWALQRNTHLAAQFLCVPVPFRPDSKALNISGVLRRVCNMVIPVSGLAFPVSAHCGALVWQRWGKMLAWGRPTCLQALGTYSHTHNGGMLAWVGTYNNIHWHSAKMCQCICTCCIYTYRWDMSYMLTHMLHTLRSKYAPHNIYKGQHNNSTSTVRCSTIQLLCKSCI